MTAKQPSNRTITNNIVPPKTAEQGVKDFITGGGAAAEETYKSKDEKLKKELEQKRKDFYKAMADTLKEDQDGEYAFLSSKVDKPIDEYGNLTEAFKEELREFKQEELIHLEEAIKNARLPTEDIFGIKRRFCQVCEQGCVGYQPNTLMVPGSSEFPTFCKHCKCPAHFHQVCVTPKDIVFPPELQQTIKNYNISQKDINFNSIVTAFQVRDLENYNQNLAELVAIFKEEGLEILSIDRRFLEIEEAIYFKSRMIGQTENLILTQLGLKQGSAPGKTNDIRKDGYAGSSYLNKNAANDPFLMNVYADQKEAKLIKMQQTMMNQKTNQNLHLIEGVTLEKSQKPLQQQQQLQGSQLNQTSMNPGLLQQTINQRVPMNSAPSIARTSNIESDIQETFQVGSFSLIKRETVFPKPKEKNFKVKTYCKNKTQKKKSFLTAIPEDIQEYQITQQIESNPLLKELITREVLIIAVGSSTYQNLEIKLKNQVMQKIQQFLPTYEMPLLYMSENKILALEDCITFFPALFRLTKSIVISEPLVEFNNITGDITTTTALQLRQADPNVQKLQKKISNIVQKQDSLTRGASNEGILSSEEGFGGEGFPLDENLTSEDGIDGDDDGRYFRSRKTLSLKVSSKLKRNIIMRETLKQTGQINEEFKTALSRDNTKIGGGPDQDFSWVERAKNREKIIKKRSKLLNRRNKMLYNFGVLHDVFNYSAMAIQESLQEINLQNAQHPNEKNDGIYKFRNELDAVKYSQNSNIFAIAKIGLPNLILPSSLDIKLSNYNTYASYLYLSDIFFPKLSSAQHSVLVLRPIIVKNGLNNLFVQILKINDFTIIKRKIRMLNKSEVLYLAEVEHITNDKSEMYYNLMMDGEVEIIVVSKLGAVSDLKTLVDGSNPAGRRRIAQVNEDSSSVRSNVDSVNSMFEITPFSSMSEFIDLEDFIVSHSRLEKYRKLQQSKDTAKVHGSSRINEQLFFYKIEQIRRELNLFQRYFNIVAHSSPSEYDAQKEMCILMPETAIIEEAIIILNPIYNNYYESAQRLLIRMGFKILQHKNMTLKEEDVKKLFTEKTAAEASAGAFAQTFGVPKTNKPSQGADILPQKDPTAKQLYTLGDKLSDFLNDTQVHIFHLSKISGDREIRQIFKDSQIEYDDIFCMKVRTTPFKPAHFPLLFLFMDTPYMFETALRLAWYDYVVDVSGVDLIEGLDGKQRLTVLDLALQVTVGDKIKELSFDRNGSILNPKSIVDETQHLVVTKIPQIFQLFGNPAGSPAVHFLVESEAHGLFEIRFSRLPTLAKQDFYNLGIDPEKLDLNYLRMRYFTKFQILNFYYNEVNKYFYNVCPAFYRFKICPLVTSSQVGADQLNRVFEVEEYMGKIFMEEIANMHQDHLRMMKHQQKTIGGWQYLTEDQQKSLPPYVWGLRLAHMCKDLEKIRGNDTSQLVGAGKLRFEDGMLKGEVGDDKAYYEFDKKRYLRYLEDFKKGWNYYLSVLECDLIEQKLKHILNSYTFKYSRQASQLSLIPDRMQEINLRISEKVKILIEEALKKESKEKFFTHLKEDIRNPHQEENAVNIVQSLLHTLYIENVKPRILQEELKKKEGGYKVEDLEQMAKDNQSKNQYSIHKDCAVVGVEVARRPKYQLLASIYYLINFWLRKIERRTELFQDIERQFIEKSDSDPEKDYDLILDILLKSIQENYGNDEYNYALDMAKLQQGYETDVEKLIREKQTMHELIKEHVRQRVYEEQRKIRTTMTIDQLIHTQCTLPQREYELKQRELLRKFVETKGYMDFQGEGFLGVLKETQSYLGPYSIKLAHEYLKRFEKQEMSKQEKISFVKMEYFLYAVTEAHRNIQELKQMESRINQFHDELDISKKDYVNHERYRMQHPSTMNLSQQLSSEDNLQHQASSQSTNRLSSEAAIHQRKIEFLKDLEKKIEKLRYQISYKETELVLIFRELMSWDYFVPDHYFDTQLLLQKQQAQQQSEAYILPMRTFWKPVFFEAHYEKNLMHDKFAAKVRDYSKTQLGKEQPKGHQGVLISYLRPYDNRDPSDYMKFDKYCSMGEWREHKEIGSIHSLIKEKTTQVQNDYKTMLMTTPSNSDFKPQQ